MEQDGELVQRLFPCPGLHGPLFGSIPQGQIEQLGRCLVAREMAPVFDDLPQTHVQALDGVGGVDDPTDGFRVGEKRDDMLPVSSP